MKFKVSVFNNAIILGAHLISKAKLIENSLVPGFELKPGFWLDEVFCKIYPFNPKKSASS